METEKETNSKKAKKIWIFGGIGLAAIIIVLILLLAQGKGIEFPYGIDPTSSISAMAKKMEEQGFSVDGKIYDDHCRFKNTYVYGVMTDYSELYIYPYDKQTWLSHHYSSESSNLNLEDSFNRVKKELISIFGNTSEYNQNGRRRLDWDKGGKVFLQLKTDEDNKGFTVEFSYAGYR